MAVATVEAVPVRSRTSSVVPIAWISAAGFAVSSVWSALIDAGVTQKAAPQFPNASLDAALMAHYSWFATTLQQERIVTGIAIAAFATMIVAVWALRARLGSMAPATAGTLLVSLGSAVWIVGNVMQLGGHRAVGSMANNGNPLETANAINFTVDMIDDAFELAGFALLGVGMACLAVAAWRGVRASGWSMYTAALSVLLLALAAAHAADSGDMANIILMVVGALLTPVWLVWSERVGGATTASDPSSSRTPRSVEARA